MPPLERTRTYELTERQTTACALTPADVEHLLGQHRTHLQLVPTSEPGCYGVRARGHVGTITAPDCRIVIRPKLPLENLACLLDWRALSGEAPAAHAASAGVTDLLAARLAGLMAERARTGLQRGYRERTECGAFLRGAPDVSAQVRDGVARRDRLTSRTDEFTTDVPCNQVIRGTAERVLAWSTLDPEVRRALVGGLAYFTGIESLLPSLELLDRLTAEPRLADYRPVLELCGVLGRGFLSGADGPGPLYPSFLLDMDRVFEDFCLGALTQALASTDDVGKGLVLQRQRSVRAIVAGKQAPELRLVPDLVVERDGRPVLVLDTKWKRLPRAALLTPDVHQVLAYAAALGVPRAFLVYPGKQPRRSRYRFPGVPVHLSIQSLGVASDVAELRRSMSDLASAVRRSAGGR